MNSKLLYFLAFVCIVCALIIFGEWLYVKQARKHALEEVTSVETEISHDEMPGIELNRKSEQSYADLVSRPLFIKGRRPVDEPSSEEAQTIGAGITFDWQLDGVYTSKKGLSALFSRSTSKVPKDKHRKITAGDDLDGWKLTEILQDKVILNQGSQRKELLLRKPKLKDLPKNLNVPNMPNVPDIPQPPVGELENQ